VKETFPFVNKAFLYIISIFRPIRKLPQLSPFSGINGKSEERRVP
jgi:hypothetical protein